MKHFHVQTFSLNDIPGLSLQDKLKYASEIGFDGVELSGNFSEIAAEEMLTLLEKFGLQAEAAHIAYDQINARLPYLKNLGIRMAIIPTYYMDSHNDALKFAEALNLLGEIASSYGVIIGYHNHPQDFWTPPDSNESLIETLACNTDPSTVFFELDCGWAATAGISPADWIRNHKKRVRALHIKDSSMVIGPRPPEKAPEKLLNGLPNPAYEDYMYKILAQRRLNCAIGSGIVDWQDIKAAIGEQEHFGEPLYVVEREFSYDENSDRIACLQADLDWLHKYFK